MDRDHHKPGAGDGSGFTLIELVIIIVILGVIATVGIPVMGRMINSSRISATREEMINLKTAIVGRTHPQPLRGYENDVGSPPPDLQALSSKPSGVSDWDKFTGTGWNGPYINGDSDEYLRDAWGVNYVYSLSDRAIKSVGGQDTLTVVF
jgi:general secretion pathway protein G